MIINFSIENLGKPTATICLGSYFAQQSSFLSGSLPSSSLHPILIAIHTEDPLRGSGILKVLNFLLAIATLEAAFTESLVASKDCKIFNLIIARRTTIHAVVANE